MSEATQTTAPVEDKQTIAQKVELLQAEKTKLTSNVNELPESEKANVQERIATIDRKIRWYAGRSAEGKSAGRKPRPSQAKPAKSPKKPTPAPAAAAPVSSPANES